MSEVNVWDLQAKKAGVPLAKLYGGTRPDIAVGVSLGIEDSIAELLERIIAFIAEGYRRIKIKIKPGWDVGAAQGGAEKISRHVFSRQMPTELTAWPGKETLKKLDEFGLLMLEQPFPPYDLWDHSRLQKEMKTPLCLDESIISEDTARQALEMGSCRIINIKVGRVWRDGGSPEESTISAGRREFRSGAAGCSNRASAGPTTCTSPRSRILSCPMTSRRASDITRRT